LLILSHPTDTTVVGWQREKRDVTFGAKDAK